MNTEDVPLPIGSRDRLTTFPYVTRVFTVRAQYQNDDDRPLGYVEIRSNVIGYQDVEPMDIDGHPVAATMSGDWGRLHAAGNRLW